MNNSLHLEDANITVVGAGLMGGSIVKALKAGIVKPRKMTVLDINKDVLKKIEKLSLADCATDNAEKALADADLVVLSLYPAKAINFVKENASCFKRGCVITDICGVKRELIETIPGLLPEGVHYVGGHPMAGTEHKGFDHSQKDIFKNCKYIIQEGNLEGKELVREFALSLGTGQIVESSAELHDELIAYTSQLPHVIAIAYMLCAKQRNVEEFSASSFRDVTRVAMINDEMWSEIFCENKDMLAREVEAFKKGIAQLEEYIKKGDTKSLQNEMKIASAMREKVNEIM